MLQVPGRFAALGMVYLYVTHPVRLWRARRHRSRRTACFCRGLTDANGERRCIIACVRQTQRVRPHSAFGDAIA